MQTTDSWAWYTADTWPGFSLSNKDNVGTNGNGLSIDPGGIAPITFMDADEDGVISDADSDDVSVSTGDRISIGGVERTVHEIGLYDNSTFTVNGETYSVSLVVWVFQDGSYMVRVNDADIPPDTHFSKTEVLELGTWNPTEYDGTYVATRSQGFYCFAVGTRIDTPDGPRLIETLRAGDLVTTLDHGPQPVVLAMSRRVRAMGTDAPVRFATERGGALVVSPQHRMLVVSRHADLLFGSPEVLVAARHLVDDITVVADPRPSVRYVHLMLPRHEIVLAEGLRTESFHPGDHALFTMDPVLRDHMLALMAGDMVKTARPCLTGWEARLLRAVSAGSADGKAALGVDRGRLERAGDRSRGDQALISPSDSSFRIT